MHLHGVNPQSPDSRQVHVQSPFVLVCSQALRHALCVAKPDCSHMSDCVTNALWLERELQWQKWVNHYLSPLFIGLEA